MPDSLERQLRNRIRELEGEVDILQRRIRQRSPRVIELLSHRGFRVFRSASSPRNVLLPADPRFHGPFVKSLRRYSFRLFLRDIIRHSDQIPRRRTTAFITEEVYSRYLDHVTRWGLVKDRGGLLVLDPPVGSFGPTLEWWVEHLMVKRLRYSCIRRVTFRGQPVSGDFDLIASVEGRLAYLEVKSSPPKQIHDREVASLLERGRVLRPSVTVLFVDTELRMKDKLVPMIEQAMLDPGKEINEHPGLTRLEGEIFHRSHELYLVNSKGGVEENLSRIFADHLRNGPPVP